MSLDCGDSLDRDVVVESEGKLNVKVDDLGLIHFWLIARGNNVFG